MLAALVVLVVGGSDVRCEYLQRGWEVVGLESLCVVLSPASREAQVTSAMSRWSLTEPQARCAVAAHHQARQRKAEWDDSERGSFESWRECVSQWPEVKALWVGLINAWDYSPLEELVAKLPLSLATELLRIHGGPRAALCLHVLKAQPDRLSEFLKFRSRFEIALVTLTQRRKAIREGDWEPLGQAAVGGALQRGDLVLAAELWRELPEGTKAVLLANPIPEVGETREGGDQRARLALRLLLAGDKAEASRVPLEGDPLELDPLVVDAVTWHLTGHRSFDAWDAAIETRQRQRGARGLDLFQGLLPFSGPYFGVANVRPLIKDGFSSRLEGTAYGDATRAILRSARAKSFLRLEALLETSTQPGVADAPANLERLVEIYIATLTARRCSSEVHHLDASEFTVERRGPQSWTVTRRTQPSGGWCTHKLDITFAGDNRAFIEFARGFGRADRAPSNEMMVKILDDRIP